MLCSNSELWQYYTAFKVTHGAVVGSGRNVAKIYRAVQRLDGFVSVDADHSGGEFTTPVLVFEGSKLELNIDCSALGETWVEIQDEKGRTFQGYAMKDCDPVDLNHTSVTVTWKNNSDVSNLQEKPVRLRFKMRLSKLYSFGFRK